MRNDRVTTKRNDTSSKHVLCTGHPQVHLPVFVSRFFHSQLFMDSEHMLSALRLACRGHVQRLSCKMVAPSRHIESAKCPTFSEESGFHQKGSISGAGKRPCRMDSRTGWPFWHFLLGVARVQRLEVVVVVLVVVLVLVLAALVAARRSAVLSFGPCFFLRPFFRGRSGPSSTASCRTSGALALGRALSIVLGHGVAPSVGLIESLGCSVVSVARLAELPGLLCFPVCFAALCSVRVLLRYFENFLTDLAGLGFGADGWAVRLPFLLVRQWWWWGGGCGCGGGGGGGGGGGKAQSLFQGSALFSTKRLVCTHCAGLCGVTKCS